MDLKEIKKYLEENKDNEEIQTFVQGLNPITLDSVKAFVAEDKEGKSWFDSERDKHSSKSLETWKNNNLESLLDEEIKKRFPEKSEHEIELEKIKKQLADMEAEKLRESLTNKAIKLANEKKLPLELVDFCVSKDEESTIANITKIEEIFSKHLQTEVENRLKSNSYTPPSGEGKTGFTLEQIKNMSPEEYAKHKDEINKLIASGLLK
ncbi:MAG: DUF4355 domain-containing protein [Spirochaetales bacterium]|nr:DUF4355 domain-containing protein [Spirochaetales bacterium]